MKRLIVHADDLGLHPGMNAAILQCHREGIVTSASLCPNGAAFEDAVAGLKGTRLDVGVHLTLSGEAPLSPPESVPTLAPGGKLPAYFTALFRRLLLGQVRKEELERELLAQISRVRDAGVEVSHLDSHQHVHLHPALLPIVIRLASHFGVGAIRAAARVVPLRGVRPALLAVFARAGARKARRAGLRSPDTIVGVADTGSLDEARLLRTVSRLPPGTSELICHPGMGSEALATAYPDWGFRWEEETRALTSGRVREALAREGVNLISYREL